MRLRNKPWAIPELEQDPRIYFDPVENKGKWNTLFGNEHPIYLELGAGRGSFSLESAKRHPDINYVAVEKEANAFVYASRLYRENPCENLLGVRTVAERLNEFFAEEEIDRIYINFCNPWPKPRQHKRRLSHPRLLEVYREILKEGGEIFLKTDDRPFFEDTIAYFSSCGFEIVELHYDLPADFPGNIVTEYETKWRGLGMPIHYICAEKRKMDESACEQSRIE